MIPQIVRFLRIKMICAVRLRILPKYDDYCCKKIDLTVDMNSRQLLHLKRMKFLYQFNSNLRWLFIFLFSDIILPLNGLSTQLHSALKSFIRIPLRNGFRQIHQHNPIVYYIFLILECILHRHNGIHRYHIPPNYKYIHPHHLGNPEYHHST